MPLNVSAVSLVQASIPLESFPNQIALVIRDRSSVSLPAPMVSCADVSARLPVTPRRLREILKRAQ
jgi:hypothetical protein